MLRGTCGINNEEIHKAIQKAASCFCFVDKRVPVRSKKLLKCIYGVWLLQFFQIQFGLSLSAPGNGIYHDKGIQQDCSFLQKLTYSLSQMNCGLSFSTISTLAEINSGVFSFVISV